MKKAILYHFLSGPSYGADVSAYVAKLNSLSLTLPTGAELAAINTLMLGLRTAYPTELDTVNIYGLGSLQTGTINIEDPETHRHTFPAGDPTYTSIQGVASDGVGTYINTQYNTNQYAGIELNIMTILYVSESSTAFSTTKTAVGARIITGSNINTLINPLTTAAVGSRQRYGAADTFANTNMKGLYISGYDGANAAIYKDWDGVTGMKDLQALTPTAPDITNPVFLLARNGNTSGGSTPGNYFPHTVSLLIRIRKQVTDGDATGIKTLIDAFRGSIGLATFVIAAGVWDFSGVFSFTGTWNI